MTTPTSLERNFRCVGIAEAGQGYVTVNLSQERDDQDNAALTAPYGGNFSLYLPAEEARDYFPGQRYTVTLTPLEN